MRPAYYKKHNSQSVPRMLRHEFLIEQKAKKKNLIFLVLPG